MKILYFTRDFSAKNVAFAKQHGLTMRNAGAVDTGVNPEPCDAVYGDDVPSVYLEKYEIYTLPEKVDVQTVEKLQARIAQLEAQLAEKSKKTVKKDEA